MKSDVQLDMGFASKTACSQVINSQMKGMICAKFNFHNGVKEFYHKDQLGKHQFAIEWPFSLKYHDLNLYMDGIA